MGASLSSFFVFIIIYLGLLVLIVSVAFWVIKKAVISALRFLAEEEAAKAPPVDSAEPRASAEARLQELADLKEKNLITANEYATQRAAVIGDV